MTDRGLWVPLMTLLERNTVISLPQAAQLLGVTQDEVFTALEELAFSYDAAGEGLILERSYASLTYGGDGRAPRLLPEEQAALEGCLHAPDADALEGDGTPAHARASAETERILSTVASACEDAERHLLSIAYQGEDDVAPVERLVEPLWLRSANGHLYLRAYCCRARGERDFRLDRIQAARVDRNACALPRHEARALAQAALQEGNGASTTPKGTASVTATLTLQDERLTEELPQARVTQRFESGWCEVQLPWHGSTWLPKHIAASGGSIRPVRPTALREATRAYLQELLEEL